MRRRTLLKLIGLAPAGMAVPAQRRPAHPTPELAASVHELADQYQALYHSTEPSVLMVPVVAHLETVRDVLRENITPAMRRRFMANQARVAMLAGRISFFDMSDSMGARGYYNLALEAACEAGDHLQAAAALGHTAFIPAADHGYAAALDYLRGAASHVSRQPHGPVSSWLAAIESEMHTNAGSSTAALKAIDRARDDLHAPSLAADLPWFDYYDSIRLDGFAGYTSLRAGRFDESRATLSNALDQLPRDAVKQRAVFLCDLATVHLHDGDLDKACLAAVEAAEQLRQTGYATGSGRLQELRTSVSPWNATPAVRMLDEQLAQIA